MSNARVEMFFQQFLTQKSLLFPEVELLKIVRYA